MIVPFFFLYAHSNFDPRTRSLTKIVESTSSLETAGLSSIFGTVSGMNCFTIVSFSVLGFLFKCRSNADFPCAPISVLSANKTLDNPDVSLVKTISLSILSRSFVFCGSYHPSDLSVPAVVSYRTHYLINAKLPTKLIIFLTFEHSGSNFTRDSVFGI